MIKRLKVKDKIQCGQLATACDMIREGNAAKNAGEKKADAGKQAILHWLETERGMQEYGLQIGDLITIECGTGEMIKLEIKGKMRVNQTDLQVKFPEVFEAVYQRFAEKNFSVLMGAESLASLRVEIREIMERAQVKEQSQKGEQTL
jgi:hypothetical protein